MELDYDHQMELGRFMEQHVSHGLLVTGERPVLYKGEVDGWVLELRCRPCGDLLEWGAKTEGEAAAIRTAFAAAVVRAETGG